MVRLIFFFVRCLFLDLQKYEKSDIQILVYTTILAMF